LFQLGKINLVDFQKLNNFDPAFEALIASCLEIQPLNIKQKFMRIYAEIYIALEKISECMTQNSVYGCAVKVKLNRHDIV
jgi:hypothetical protein